MVSAPASPIKAPTERPKLINKRHTLAPSRGILKPFTQNQMNHEGNHTVAIMPMKEPFKPVRDETIKINRRVSFAPEVTLHKIKMVPSLPSPPSKLPRRRETIHFIPPPKELLSSKFRPEEEDGGRNILSDSSEEEDMELDDDENVEKVNQPAHHYEEESSMDETEVVFNKLALSEQTEPVEDEAAMDLTVGRPTGELIKLGVDDHTSETPEQRLNQDSENESQEEVAMELTQCVASRVDTKALTDKSVERDLAKTSDTTQEDNEKNQEANSQEVAMEFTQHIPISHEEVDIELTQAVPVYEDKPQDVVVEASGSSHDEEVPMEMTQHSGHDTNAEDGENEKEIKLTQHSIHLVAKADHIQDAEDEKEMELTQHDHPVIAKTDIIKDTEEEKEMELTQHSHPVVANADITKDTESEEEMELTQHNHFIAKADISGDAEDEEDMELTQSIHPVVEKPVIEQPSRDQTDRRASIPAQSIEGIEDEEDMELTQSMHPVAEKPEIEQSFSDQADRRASIPAHTIEDMELTQIRATPEKAKKDLQKRTSRDLGSPEQTSAKRQKVDYDMPTTPPKNTLEESLMTKINSLTPRRGITHHNHQTGLAEPLIAHPIDQSRREEAVTTTIPLADVSTSSIQEDDYTPVTLRHFMELIGVKFYDDLHVKEDVSEYSQFTSKRKIDSLEYVCAFPQLPILELQSFSCKELRKNVEEGQNIFTQLEADTAHDNSPLMREFMEADPAVQRNMMLQFQTIKSFSREQAQSLWYSWRIQLMEGVFSAIAKNEAKIKQDFEEVGRSLQAKEDENASLEQKANALQLRLEKLVKHKTEFQNCDRNSLLQLREELIELTDSILQKQKDIQQLESLQADLRDKVSKQLVQMEHLKGTIELKKAQSAKLKVFGGDDISHMKRKLGEMMELKEITNLDLKFPVVRFELSGSIKTTLDLKTGKGCTNIDMLQKGASKGGVLLVKLLQEKFNIESQNKTGREYMHQVLQFREDTLRLIEQFRILELKYPVRVTLKGSHLDVSVKLMKTPGPMSKSIASWTISPDSIQKGLFSGPMSVEVINYGSRQVLEDPSLKIDFVKSLSGI